MVRNRKFCRTGEERMQVDYDTGEDNNNYNHLLNYFQSLSWLLTEANHQGAKNITVKKKNRTEEEDKNFVKAT